MFHVDGFNGYNSKYPMVRFPNWVFSRVLPGVSGDTARGVLGHVRWCKHRSPLAFLKAVLFEVFASMIPIDVTSLTLTTGFCNHQEQECVGLVNLGTTLLWRETTLLCNTRVPAMVR